MKTLRIVAWTLVVGCYYAVCYIGGWFLGVKLGEAIGDMLVES